MFGLTASSSTAEGNEKTLKIVVQGTSSITRTAERAIVSIQVSTEGKDREYVSNQAMTTAKELQTRFTQLSQETKSGESIDAAAVTAWSMRALYTSFYTPRDHNGVDLDCKYTANTSFEIEVQNFTRLSSVTTELLAMPNVSIHNTSWRLTEKTKKSLGTQSRKEAIQEALMKAKDFAEAAGYGSVKPFEITDGYSGEEFVSENPAGKMIRGNEETALSFVPEEIQLRSNVTVKFYAE
jgi:uncharacterized protein YggE